MIDEKSEKYEDDARNQISQCDAELDAHSCAYLIDWISHSCPRLEKLRLFPSNQSSTPNKLAHSAYDNLANLTNLRSFTLVMSDVYDNVFQALDQLPHLEELILIGTSQCLSAPDPITLADGSFPHLQYLGLYGLCESSTARICKAAPLFRHLIKVDVIYSEPDAESFMDYDRTIAALESIGHNTPHLKDITIYPRGNYGYFVAILPVVDLFKQMSLTRLDLGYTIFNPQEVGYDEGDWGYEGDEVTRNSSLEAQWTAFLSAVPRLEELRLEQQGFWEVQLERMASLLPNLRLLVAQIVWFVGPSEEVNASQTIVIRSQLHLYPHQSIPEIVAFVNSLVQTVRD
ncbi:hypothetical protein FRC09_000332 [Ceratobasidium sp. 395]|nr:hypothetical protein FRC09_000332 [Ceratobasidium sp. 395]